MSRSEQPWSVPIRIDDVPQTGRHIDLRADAATRAAVAHVAGLAGLARMEAAFDLTRSAAGALHVVGRVAASAQQTCVVTLEPITSEIGEAVDLVFVPGEPAPSIAEAAELAATTEPPEPLVGGTVDLGALAVEFLMLGIDPYPRKPDAVFDPPADADEAAGPFAALAALKKNPRSS